MVGAEGTNLGLVMSPSNAAHNELITTSSLCGPSLWTLGGILRRGHFTAIFTAGTRFTAPFSVGARQSPPARSVNCLSSWAVDCAPHSKRLRLLLTFTVNADRLTTALAQYQTLLLVIDCCLHSLVKTESSIQADA